jgi:hypothetical protein
MKTITLKKAMQMTVFCTMLLATVIITKNTIKNVKQLYGSEKASNNSASCFFDMIH